MGTRVSDRDERGTGEFERERGGGGTGGGPDRSASVAARPRGGQQRRGPRDRRALRPRHARAPRVARQRVQHGQPRDGGGVRGRDRDRRHLCRALDRQQLERRPGQAAQASARRGADARGADPDVRRARGDGARDAPLGDRPAVAAQEARDRARRRPQRPEGPPRGEPPAQRAPLVEPPLPRAADQAVGAEAGRGQGREPQLVPRVRADRVSVDRARRDARRRRPGRLAGLPPLRGRAPAGAPGRVVRADDQARLRARGRPVLEQRAGVLRARHADAPGRQRDLPVRQRPRVAARRPEADRRLPGVEPRRGPAVGLRAAAARRERALHPDRGRRRPGRARGPAEPLQAARHVGARRRAPADLEEPARSSAASGGGSACSSSS